MSKNPYLHPLGQQLGVLRGLLLVLRGALSLEGDAAALVLQHTGCHQPLDPGSLSPGLLAYQREGVWLMLTVKRCQEGCAMAIFTPTTEVV